MKKWITLVTVLGAGLLTNSPTHAMAWYHEIKLYTALRDGQKPQVEELLAKHPELLNATLKKGFTPLMVAAFHGHLGLATYLLDEKKVPVNAQNSKGKTALMLAAGRPLMHPIVQLLLTHHACINAQDAKGKTALMIAAEHGGLPSVQLLVANGAYVTISARGKTAYDLAIQKRHDDVAHYLDAIEQLLTAAENGDTAQAQRLVTQYPTIVHAQDHNAYTPLMAAAAHGRLAMVDYLVTNHADVNVKTINKIPHSNAAQATALLLACHCGHGDIVRYLVEHGADLNAQNSYGETALIQAVINDDHKTVAFLITQGAKLNLKTAYDLTFKRIELNEVPAHTTALHFAIKCGQWRTAELLIEHDADVNARDTKQETALTMAVAAGHLPTVQLLLKHRAIVTNHTNTGENALTIAAYTGHTEVLKALIGAGANVNVRNTQGKTALMCAAQAGNSEAARYLVKEAHAALYLSDTRSLSLAAQRQDIVKYLDTVLLTAAKEGDGDFVKRLIAQGADVNAVDDDDGMTVLMVAIQNSHPDIAQFLITNTSVQEKITHTSKTKVTTLMLAAARGYVPLLTTVHPYFTDLNARDLHATTALMFAVKNEQKIAAQFLLDHGANVNARDSDGLSALTHAILSGNVAIVCMLLTYGAQITSYEIDEHIFPIAKNPTWPEIKTYLTAARELLDTAAQGNVKRISELCAHYPGIAQVRNAKGETALMIAVTQKHLETAKALIIAGHADLHARAQDNKTIYDSARINYPAFARYLDTILMEPALSENVVLIQQLVDQGAPVDSRDSDGKTALMVAAELGKVESITVLLRNYADINAVDDAQQTALALAAANGHAAIVQQLLKAGADITIADKKGVTILMQAARNSHANVERIILANPRSAIDAQNRDGFTALMLAAATGDQETIRELVRGHARVDLADHKGGYTALMHAALTGQAGNVRCLIVEGQANLRLRDKSGKTARELALKTKAETQGRLVTDLAGKLPDAIALIKKYDDTITCFNTILEQAVAGQACGLTRQLIAQGAADNTDDLEKAYQQACASGNKSLMDLLFYDAGYRKSIASYHKKSSM